MNNPRTCTAFDGDRRFASGDRLQVALAIKALLEQRPDAAVLIFDDDTGSQIDFDLRGSSKEIAARLTEAPPEADHTQAARSPGRPKLGVIPREVTLLPRHWDWLAKQPGGASVTLRKLVEEARRTSSGAGAISASRERAYRFMAAKAGNLPNFEEATRALFAGDGPQFSALIAVWPDDVRDYAAALAGLSCEAA